MIPSKLFRLFTFAALGALVGGSCRSASGQTPQLATSPVALPPLPGAPLVGEKVEKSAEQWRAELSAQAFQVLREQGTERAFSGEFWDEHDEGVYRCAGCSAPLFTSAQKFDSGTGWPSFTAPAEAGRVGETVDASHGMTRTEVHCEHCGGHLGHVFPDGPAPTGLRYCINSVSLTFQPMDVTGDGTPASAPVTPTVNP